MTGTVTYKFKDTTPEVAYAAAYMKAAATGVYVLDGDWELDGDDVVVYLAVEGS